MRNIAILLLSISILHFGSSYAQNVPATTTDPLLPSVPLGTLTAPYTPTSGLLNLTRVFVPSIKTDNLSHPIFSLSPSSSHYKCKVVSQYQNGWGDVIQTISRGDATGSSGSPDVLSPVDLRLSHTTRSFLPYSLPACSRFQSSSFADQRSYYSTHEAAENGFSYSQSVTSYPGGVKTIKECMPGSSFVGNYTGNTITVTINDGSEGIVKYPESLIGTVTYYEPSKLTIKTTLSPPDGRVEDYFDMNDRQVCKKVYTHIGTTSTATMVSTYYVYDERGQLIKIITPSGSNELAALPTADISQLSYSYTYNAYGSVTTKSTPGKSGVEYTVYDKKNRPVLFQSPLLNSLGKYRFNIYDSRDRVIISGLLTDATPASAWQATLYADPATLTIPSGSLLYYFVNGVPATYPTVISGCEIDQVNFYDEYVVPRYFVPSTHHMPTSMFPEAVTPVPYVAVNGLLTASMSRLRSGGMGPSGMAWICSVYFYDQNGNVIQTQTLNPAHPATYATCLAGAPGLDWDVLTTQYNFNGQKLTEVLDYYDFATSDKPLTRIYHKYERDATKAGRLKATWEAIDDGGGIAINRYEYDDLGRVTEKSLGGVEKQKYDYNIRGQLTAINKDYALYPCGTVAATSTFGVILNYDFGFTQPRFDGNISGIKWRGASSITPLRAYGYEYDPSAKLKHAEFRQYCLPTSDHVSCTVSLAGETWNKARTDFTTSNIRYDRNGNMLSMHHKGTTATGPVDMDDLTYEYFYRTNSLYRVNDAVTTDFHLGDFLDVSLPCEAGGGGLFTYLPCEDYAYDADGNLKKDLNKHITNIEYNELDQPLSVTYDDGSYINNLYTSTGILYYKAMYKAGSLRYDEYRNWGPFQYKNSAPVITVSTDPWKLQYVLHEEGRTRYSPLTNLFTYDYFVKDHLGNVRTVVTGNQTNADPEYPLPSGMVAHDYVASHEVSSAALEDAVFLNIDMVRDDRPESYDTTNEKCARLNGGDTARRIGTAIMLKVMAGDQFNLSAQSYWYDEDTIPPVDSSSALLSAIVSTLSGAQGNVNMGENTATQLIADAFSPTNYALYQAMLDSITDPSRPKAYINYVVFDEHMTLLPEESGAIQVGATSGTWTPLTSGGPISIRTSGFLAVYISDASVHDVFIDGLEIGLAEGKLIQEQHYYPFGLTINMGESGTALKNKFKYQGKELMDEIKLNLYDFTARQYDPQIGRFWGIDPASQYPSGYTGMGNNPANMIDPTGCVSNMIKTPWQSDANEARYSSALITNKGFDDMALHMLDQSDGFAEIRADMERHRKAFADNKKGDGEGHHSKYLGYIELKNGVILDCYGHEATPYEMMQISMYNMANRSVPKGSGLLAFAGDGKGDKKGGLNNGTILDGIQTGLDVVGLIPGFGEIADGVNALIYTGRGDYVNAGLSTAAMIPLAGWAATGGKLGNKALRFTKDQEALIDLAKEAQKRGGVTIDEAKILKDWSKEYNLPFRGPEIHPNRNFNSPHIHIGPVNHLRIKP